MLEVLSSSPELLGLLHKVDAACHSRLVASSPASDHVLKYVPSIREQLKVGTRACIITWSFKWCKNVEKQCKPNCLHDMHIFIRTGRMVCQKVMQMGHCCMSIGTLILGFSVTMRMGLIIFFRYVFTPSFFVLEGLQIWPSVQI